MTKIDQNFRSLDLLTFEVKSQKRIFLICTIFGGTPKSDNFQQFTIFIFGQTWSRNGQNVHDFENGCLLQSVYCSQGICR